MKDSLALKIAFIVLLLVIGVMLLPMPHGGTLGGNFFEHWRYETRQEAYHHADEKKKARLQKFNEEKSKRFSQALSFEENAEQPADQNWKSVTLDNGYPGLLDIRTGMVWGGMMKQSFNDWTMNDVKAAMDDCASTPPEGGWALPTAAEFDLAKVNGIIQVDSNARHRWLTYIDSADLSLSALRIWGEQSTSIDFRCIGRSESAPAHGYGADDVGNDVTLKALQ